MAPTPLAGGKSAIMTAIIVGLGGKPNFARGNALKDLIKTGERFVACFIEVC